MKILFISLTFIVILSCNSEKKKEYTYMDIMVIRDVTDPHELQPDANSILGLYNLTEDKNISANFKYHEITDRMLVPVVSLRLPDKSTTSKLNKKNESLFREKVILSFYDTIRKTLAPYNTSSAASFLNHSECFRTISGELRSLVQSNSQNKLLLIFSNLFENSDILNVYSKGTRSLLLINGSLIKDRFEKSNLLPENLQSIKIFFLYKPKDREEDQEFMKMAEIYKQILSSKGAEIFVQADNNYLN